MGALMGAPYVALGALMGALMGAPGAQHGPQHENCTAVMCFTGASQARQATGCPWFFVELVPHAWLSAWLNLQTQLNTLGKY